MKKFIKTLVLTLSLVLCFSFVSESIVFATETTSSQATTTSTAKKKTKKKKTNKKAKPKVPKVYSVPGQRSIPHTAKFEFKNSAIMAKYAPIKEGFITVDLSNLRNEKGKSSYVYARVYYRNKYNTKWVAGGVDSIKVGDEKTDTSFQFMVPAGRPFYVKLYKKVNKSSVTKGTITVK